MNTKTTLSLVTSVLLATTLFTSSLNAGNHKDGQTCKSKKMMQHSKHSKSQNHSLVKMFKKLNLSEKQRAELRTLIKESRENMPNPHAAFSEKSFDKKEFIKLTKERKEQKLERKATLIEKAYNVLNKEQKKDLKTMLDMKEVMKKNKCRSSCSKR